MSSLPRALAGVLTLLLGAVAGCDGRLEFDRGQTVGGGGLASVGAIDCAGCAEAGLVCASEWQTCVECNEDSQCSDRSPYCDRALHRCTACRASGDCGSGNVCDGWSHACVRGCGSDVDPDHDCHGTDLTCDLEHGVCITCRSDEECQEDGARRCLPGGARCAACTSDADCDDSSPHCDPLAFACVECRDSRDCIAPSWCDPEEHHCEQRDD